MQKIAFSIVLLLCLISCSGEKKKSGFNLTFSSLPSSWDEAIPLGNGMTGVLIWEKEGKLRFSLDRADLWDLRPLGNIGSAEWKFSWVYDQWKERNYKAVQEKFDVPYDELPAPSKIPAAALEFDIKSFGEVTKVVLNISDAVCTIIWSDGVKMEVFVDATGGMGWYRFYSTDSLIPELIRPAYEKPDSSGHADMSNNNLALLGYLPGRVSRSDNSIIYVQEGWGGFRYSVSTAWKNEKRKSEGCWSIESFSPGKASDNKSFDVVKTPGKGDFEEALTMHKQWWKNFWARSSVVLPDTILMKQWYLEMYKFASVARADAPPVSLQAVWTADNGMLPPWKGDFHHDLNTQLSYWPAYSSNHTDLSKGFTNWLWDHQQTFKRYTKQYFGTEGLNVPGVTTLDGEPMGGWIQYSFGPTVSSWLAHHFYLQWKYTLDTVFLKEQAYPWICATAEYLKNISVFTEEGKRQLPLSSSPEFNDNSREAWFEKTTNFDISLIRWTYIAAAEMAVALNKTEDATEWEKALSEWPDLAVDKETGLMVAPGYPYAESHRHFSHLMAIHPLGIINYTDGAAEKEIVERSLENLKNMGSDYWTGYSYAWQGNLYARALRGDDAADALRVFAECFCLPNSFHANGDQSNTGKSKFTYSPFTLEGNFAFAAGIQEMLLQSHHGVIRVFPAIPADWKNVSFKTLRAEGAILVSAAMKSGTISGVTLTAEKGGSVRLYNPFDQEEIQCEKAFSSENGLIIVEMKPGETVNFKGVKK